MSRSIPLETLLEGVPVRARRGAASARIDAVVEDSRKVAPGALFVAVRGEARDGHGFVADVLRAGVAAVVVERDEGWPLDEGQVVVVVESGRRALGRIALAFFGHPELQLALVGVTGTNGKTTTTYLIEAILRAAGARPGVIGTVEYRFEAHRVPAPNTTPGPLELAEALGAMRDRGATHVVMEVTSHALVQGRVDALSFRVGAFTNLTQDHLDFHGSMQAYFDAKRRLFTERLAEDGVAVVLVDSPEGRRMIEGLSRALPCATRGDGAVRVLRQSQSVSGIEAALETPSGPLALRSPLVGDYNLENLVVAVGVGAALGVPNAAITAGLAGCAGAPGRLDRVAGPGFDAFVDYAHTPDALERVLLTMKPLTTGRLFCVFGCGGDRDRTKRPRMGAIAVHGADVAIVTSDNPRTEDPAAIVQMIVEGAREAGGVPVELTALPGASRGYAVEVDRRRAIWASVRAARPGDVVVVAGKGHEDYQILGTTKIHFDDREEVRAAMAARG